MSKLRLIQCGVGGWGTGGWREAVAASPDFELVGIVDISDAALADAGDALKIPSAMRFASLEQALASVEAHAVLTVTPPAVHLQHATLAFAHGLHLMTEKPIATDLPGAKLMVQLAHESGRQLVVAQNFRYSAPAQRLRSLVAEQFAGELGHGHIDFYIPADFSGSFRQTIEFPLLVDMAIHHLDLIRAVTGRNIIRVTAHTFNPSWSSFDHHAALKMLLELEGGIPFSYSGDWTAPGRSTTWNGTWRLQCSEGSIHLEDDKITVGRCEPWNKNPSIEPIEIPEIERTGQVELLHRFAQAIRTNQPAETSGADNLFSFGAVIGGTISSREGRMVDIMRELLQTHNSR